jgi:protein ImuB
MSAIKATAPVSLAFAQATALNSTYCDQLLGGTQQQDFFLENPDSLSEQLWLSLSFPQLALEAVTDGRQRSQACVVFEENKSQLIVFNVSESAQQAGVAPGMTLSAAKALCPTLEHYRREPEKELKRLQEIAAWAKQYTPLVSLLGIEALALEIKYSLRLYQGLKTLCGRIQTTFKENWGMDISWAVAPTPLAAYLLASNSLPAVVTQTEELRSVLGKLSVRQIGLEDKVVRSLVRMGVNYLHDLWRLPRAGLSRRLGKELLTYLDKALGLQADPQQAYDAPQQFHSEMDLPAEISDQAIILKAVDQLLDRLVGFLRERDSSTDAITIKLYHPYKPVTSVPVNLRYSTRDAQWLSDLVHEHFNRTRLEEGVIAVGLSTNNILCYQAETEDLFAELDEVELEFVVPESHESGLSGSELSKAQEKQIAKLNKRKQRQTSELLEQMQARLGDAAIKQLDSLADYRPEKAWQYTVQCNVGSDSVAKQYTGQKAGDNCLQRPFWLLSEPLSLGGKKDQPRIQYKKKNLALMSGPERVQVGWWDNDDVQRDYYVATDGSGRRLWVYEDIKQPGQWYLHGLFG